MLQQREYEEEEIPLSNNRIRHGTTSTNSTEESSSQDNSLSLNVPSTIPIGSTNLNNTSENSNNSNNSNNNSNNSSNNNNNSNNNTPQLPITRYTSLIPLWSKMNLFFIGYLIPIILAILIVLGIDWNSSCNKPLQAWLLVLLCDHSVTLAIIIRVHFGLPTQQETAAQQTTKIKKIFPLYFLNRCLDFFWFIWGILGVAWTFSIDGTTCIDSLVYKMCFTLVIIHTILLSLTILFCLFACGKVSSQYLAAHNKAPVGATKQMIKSLASKKFHTGEIPKDDATCGICLCEFEENEDLRVLPCEHFFHRDCVDQWLLINKSCPFCKRNIDGTSDEEEKKK